MPVSVSVPPVTTTSAAPTLNGAAVGLPVSVQSVRCTGPEPRRIAPSSPRKVVRTKCTGLLTGVCTTTVPAGWSKSQSAMMLGRRERADRWAMLRVRAEQPRIWTPSALTWRVPAGSKVDRAITRTSSRVRSVIFVPATNQEQTCRRTVIRLALMPHCPPLLAMSISPEQPVKTRSCSYWPWVVKGLPPASSPSPWQFSTRQYAEAVQSLRCRALELRQSTTCP